jgi:hypothetical protein
MQMRLPGLADNSRRVIIVSMRQALFHATGAVDIGAFAEKEVIQ